MRHFAPLEANDRLHLVAVLQKASCMIDTSIKIVNVNTAGKLDLLQLGDLLLLFCLLLSLVALKTVLAVIHGAAGRGRCRCGHHNQIQIAGISIFLRLVQGNDADLLTVLTEQANLLRSDLVIDR